MVLMSIGKLALCATESGYQSHGSTKLYKVLTLPGARAPSDPTNATELRLSMPTANLTKFILLTKNFTLSLKKQKIKAMREVKKN